MPGIPLRSHAAQVAFEPLDMAASAAILKCIGTRECGRGPSGEETTIPLESAGGRPGIAIVTAMGIESMGLSRALEVGPWNRRLRRGWHEGLLAGCPVVLAHCGVGPKAARRWAEVLLGEYEPQSVILTGASGGVAPHVDVGDLVLAESLYRYVDGRAVARHHSDADLLAVARAAAGETMLRPVSGRRPQVVEGGVATTDRAAGSRAWGDRLAQEHGIVAIEMEGAAIAEVCRERSVPFLVVRAVSDVVGRRWQWLTMIRNLVPAQRNAERLVFAIVERLGGAA